MWTASGSALLAILASLSSGLTIETGSPDAHCPDLAMTQKAADERLGILAVEGPGKWKAIYTIVHAPEKDGDHVHLELFNPKGARKLERDLPLAGESCATMAQVVALVLERYFSDLSQERDRPAPAPSGSARTPEAALTQKADEGDVYSAAFFLGAGWLTPPSAAAIDVGARFWVHRRVHLGLGVAWSPSQEEQQVGPPEGTARLSVVPVRASLGFGWDASFGYFYLGPDALVSFDRGTTEGITVPSDGRRIVFGLGATGGAFLWLKKPLALTFEAAVDATLPLANSQFVVSQQEVLTQQWVQGFAALGLSYVIFR
jgi:hypothetical protein